MELTAFDERRACEGNAAHNGAFDLSKDDGLPPWLAERRPAPFAVPRARRGGATMDADKGCHAQEKNSRRAERKTIITPEDERPGSEIIVDLLLSARHQPWGVSAHQLQAKRQEDSRS